MIRIAAIIFALIVLAGCSRQPDAETLVGAADEAKTRGDYAGAMDAAAHVLDLEPDSATAARACVMIADCHRAAGNRDAAMTFALRAAEFSPEERAYAVWSATEAADYYTALKELELMPRADSADNAVWLRLFIRPAIETGRRPEAMAALRELYGDSLWLSVEHRSLLARHYLEVGMPDSASLVMAGIDVRSVNDLDGLRALADYYESVGDIPSALASLRLRGERQDSLARAAQAAGVYNGLYELEHRSRMEESRRARMRIVIVAAVFTALLFLAIGDIMVLRARSRRRLLEAENRLLLASTELRTANEHSRSTIGRLFRDSFDSVELAASLLIEGAKESRVMRELNARVDACRTPEFREKLKAAVDECYDGIIDRMRERVGLNEADITTALFCAAGLSPRVVCLLLDCTPSALYNKKYRLKRKVQEADLEDEERSEYLSILQ